MVFYEIIVSPETGVSHDTSISTSTVTYCALYLIRVINGQDQEMRGQTDYIIATNHFKGPVVRTAFVAKIARGI